MAKRVLKNDFLQRAVEAHGDKYDYSLVYYVNTKTKVDILCLSHGIFSQSPDNHMQGNGCRKCADDVRADKHKKSLSDFVKESIDVHGCNYDYSLVDYTNTKNKVSIKCIRHGVFKQSPTQHLTGAGCPKCRGEKTSKQLTKNTESFIDDARRVHGDTYDYSNTEYISCGEEVSITCNLHGDFKQTPTRHLMKRGCRECYKGGGGFKVYKSAILYYLKVNNGEAYKIGVTNRSVNDRFSNSDLKNIEILEIWKYPIGEDALVHEQKIKNMYRDKRYEGILLENGNTELFSEDVLGLDIGGSDV